MLKDLEYKLNSIKEAQEYAEFPLEIVNGHIGNITSRTTPPTFRETVTKVVKPLLPAISSLVIEELKKQRAAAVQELSEAAQKLVDEERDAS